MTIFDLTNPIIILTILALFVACIVIGKRLKLSFIPLIGIITALLIFLYNSAMLFSITEEYEYLKPAILKSEIFNLALIALTFIGYLWIDDIEARAKNKKSIDNSMDWFWNKA